MLVMEPKASCIPGKLSVSSAPATITVPFLGRTGAGSHTSRGVTLWSWDPNSCPSLDHACQVSCCRIRCLLLFRGLTTPIPSPADVSYPSAIPWVLWRCHLASEHRGQKACQPLPPWGGCPLHWAGEEGVWCQHHWCPLPPGLTC